MKANPKIIKNWETILENAVELVQDAEDHVSYFHIKVKINGYLILVIRKYKEKLSRIEN